VVTIYFKGERYHNKRDDANTFVLGRTHIMFLHANPIYYLSSTSAGPIKSRTGTYVYYGTEPVSAPEDVQRYAQEIKSSSGE